MKQIILFLLAIVLAHSGIAVERSDPRMYFGSTDDWQQYTSNPNGIYVDVDFSHLNLFFPPVVHTFLTCSSRCWTATGATSIYNLSRSGFRVYLKGFGFTATPSNAQEWNFVLHYTIINQDYIWEFQTMIWPKCHFC